jgi:hypothetical protein
MAANLIYYYFDLYKTADFIFCSVCNKCEWQLDKHGNKTDQCIYGGPFGCNDRKKADHNA